jgi:transposase
MTRQEAIAFCKNNPESVADIILMVEELKRVIKDQENIIKQQANKIKELEERINKNSKNSHKPPSTDNKLKVEKKSKKEKSDRKRGGQKGRVGKSLKQVNNPDKIVELKPTTCCNCGCSLESNKAKLNAKRQVFDIPPINIEVTEYQQYEIKCPHCKEKNRTPFPDKVKTNVQYGDRLSSLVVYLNTYHMLPYERISELINDIAKHKLSVGTIYNMLNSNYKSLKEFEESLIKKLTKQEYLHSDETGINVNANLYWIHTVTNNSMTLYHIDKTRGAKAIKNCGILTNYKGILTSDFWNPYLNLEDVTNSFCNAHIIRDLQAEIDKNNYKWAKDMQKLLKETNNEVKNSKNNILSVQRQKEIEKEYDKIINEAKEYYKPPPDKKTKGRPKQEKGKNLLDRLEKYKDGILLFMKNEKVAFTNNQAERDLRMIKVKQKISGTFMSETGGKIFCRIKSYIETLKKNSKDVLEYLTKSLNQTVVVSDVVGG